MEINGLMTYFISKLLGYDKIRHELSIYFIVLLFVTVCPQKKKWIYCHDNHKEYLRNNSIWKKTLKMTFHNKIMNLNKIIKILSVIS